MGVANPFSLNNKNLDSLLLSRSKDNVATELEGEVVLLDLTSNAYIGFDAIGSSIWALLEKPITLPGLLTALMEKYDVNEDTCRVDVLSFLAELFDKNLIRVDAQKAGV
jgi:hypothetical protein